MSDKPEMIWINFTPADLTEDQREAFDMLVEARKQFEAAFTARPGYTFRFSYKGNDWDRLGMTEIAIPKSRDQVKQSLQDWLASKRAAGSRT